MFGGGRKAPAAPRSQTELFLQLMVAQLNAKFIPPCARLIEKLPDGIRYLHPRKGWHVVSRRRLGPQLYDLIPETSA